ncbi:PIH1 domain-containing protein 1-like [Anneissia japonica]|uniref:PIH1 domain-containing protein 1-like n=1 Tax=Anneissia japonica TaxID=1529436 RepID=UPI00142583AB|nr:PIH1 domain-containing protein 1-like [Anneissia japonica]
MNTPMDTNRSLLLEQPGSEEEERLYKELLLQASQMHSLESNQPACNLVQPEPGMCLKTKDLHGNKVFINICQSIEMPSPVDVTEEELTEVLESEEPGDYRVPMSLGEAHAEIDKAGQGCTAYDVLISREFYAKINKSNLFKGFFITVIYEGIENKFKVAIDKQHAWTILKNRKSMGPLQQHYIRTKSKPRILEMDSAEEMSPQASQGVKKLIMEVDDDEANKTSIPEPKYEIMREPIDGHPEFLVVEVQLPNVKTSKSLILDLGEDRILLKARPNVYHLDIYLPFDMVQDECGAQFNRDNKVLTLTLPVKPI